MHLSPFVFVVGLFANGGRSGLIIYQIMSLPDRVLISLKGGNGLINMVNTKNMR